MKKRVLVFDCWLPGFKYIRGLTRFNDTVDIEFVHTSSLQTGIPGKEYASFRMNLDIPSWCKDFQTYRYSYKEMFETIRPDALLVTSLHHMECRSALLFAKQFKISTFYIPHGIFFNSVDDEMRYCPATHKRSIKDFIHMFYRKIPRIFYYTKYFWMCHFELRREGKTVPDWTTALVTYLSVLTFYKKSCWNPNETTQEYYKGIIECMLLRSQKEFNNYKDNMGKMVDGCQYHQAAALDADKISAFLEEIHCQSMQSGSVDRPYPTDPVAYYISSPWDDFFLSNNESVYQEVILKLNQYLLDRGFSQMIYRPHPGEPKSFSDRMERQFGICVDREVSIEKLVKSRLVVGSASSLLYCAVLLNKPILVINSKRLFFLQPYYDELVAYPTIRLNIDDDKSCIEASQELNKALVGHVEVVLPLMDNDPLKILVRMVNEQH